ncbi:MAG TPA: hypothetical protein VGD48_34575 [Kutzneria sp.]
MDAPALIDAQLTMTAFTQLAGRLGGYPFVKVVVDRSGRIQESFRPCCRCLPAHR